MDRGEDRGGNDWLEAAQSRKELSGLVVVCLGSVVNDDGG
jgi:hypothetical protein